MAGHAENRIPTKQQSGKVDWTGVYGQPINEDGWGGFQFQNRPLD